MNSETPVNAPKSAEISQTKENEYTRLQFSLVQFISRLFSRIRVLISYKPLYRILLPKRCERFGRTSLICDYFYFNFFLFCKIHTLMTRLELLDLTRQHEDFPSFSYTAPSRLTSVFWGICLMLYLNWDRLHHYRQSAHCFLTQCFDLAVSSSRQTRLEPKCRSKRYISVNLCHLSTDAAVIYGYIS